MCNKAVLDEITKRVCAAAKEVLGGKLEKALLFGSYARGDYDEESDVDIFVLADIRPEDVDDIRVKIRTGLRYFGLECDVVISLHVVCSDIFHKYVNTLPFYMNVVKDGVELHAT